MHALFGNDMWYPSRTPPPRTYLWAQSFYIPNGMTVFRYSFYGKNSLWLHAHRRGSSFEIETTRRDSPTLYGAVKGAVASKGGGPGSRWHLYSHYDKLLTPTYAMTDTYDKQHLCNVRATTRPGGDQHRVAHGGTPQGRGQRSDAALLRRQQKRSTTRCQARRDYRSWKSQCKDSTLRVHGGQNPLPPIYPKPTSLKRLQCHITQSQSQSQSTRHLLHQSRDASSPLSLPLPTGTHLTLASWNIEGLKEVAKYDAILHFCQSLQISLLCVQETKAESAHSFTKSGWEILHSGTPHDKHHGVGFFVSPKLRAHITGFIPHSARVCELKLNVLPHPLTIINVYAPSMTQDAEEDRTRKAQFWADLESLLLEKPDLSHTFLVGDFNSRLDVHLDPDSNRIGPFVVGQRQSLQEDDRDNALFLFQFLEMFDLYLPQTFSPLPFSRRATYKEMTCEDHLLHTEDVKQWTALDFLVLPSALSSSVTFTGSHFQQAVNTRHLPLTFTVRTHRLPPPVPAEAPKRDFTQLGAFYDAVETQVLSLTGNHMTPPINSDPSFFVVAYTDGSCPNNRCVSYDNPAGWGFAITVHSADVHPPLASTWVVSYGSVRANPLSGHDPVVGSNNTGELKGLIELFDYLLHYTSYAIGTSIIIYTDSQYAADLLRGSSVPNSHPQLVALSQKYFTALRTQYNVALRKIPSHKGIPGNEIADVAANKGVYSHSSIGRFSTYPTSGLSPPDLFYYTEEWSQRSVTEQDAVITKIFKDALPLVPEIPLSAKKPWISAATLSLIAETQASTYTDLQALKARRKLIKKSARQDKKRFIAQNLSEDFHGANIHQWRYTRQLKSEFKPRATGLFNLKDSLVSKDKRASTFAEYLSTKIWFSSEDPALPLPDTSCTDPSMDCPFTMADLDAALRRLKPGKSPGPNEIPGELYKHAPYILKLFLLDHYNQCFETREVPATWLFSEVVMLVKDHKKDTRLLSNYRPISLTNISYKIFASMLQHRLELFFDDKIRPTQFGFRKHRSASQPIHIIRRLIEIFERQTTSFHALFLDWSKAFDSVTFTAIQAALAHLGVSTHLQSVIMSLYSSPRFLVRDSNIKSSEQVQTKGLRQGCPLSPYLFSFVLTHLFDEVESQYETRFGHIAGVFQLPSPLWDLEYADDTVLLSTSADALNRLLHLIQYEGCRRGLLLNLDKCEHLRMNSDRRLHYSPAPVELCSCSLCSGLTAPGPTIKLVEEVKYLGAYLDDKNNQGKHLRYRISQAISAAKKLKPLMTHSSLPPSWKLTVYRSVVQAILLYSVESLQLTASQLTHLDSIHYKQLRRIFKIKSSFYHRVINPTEAKCSNLYLHQLAFRCKHVQPPSQVYSQNRLKFFGHLLRHPNSCESVSTFQSSMAYRRTYGPNRAGRPKLHWSEACFTEAYDRIQHLASDSAPSHADMEHSFFSIPTLDHVRRSHCSRNLVHLDNTLLYRAVHVQAHDKERWSRIIHKPLKRHRS